MAQKLEPAKTVWYNYIFTEYKRAEGLIQLSHFLSWQYIVRRNFSIELQQIYTVSAHDFEFSRSGVILIVPQSVASRIEPLYLPALTSAKNHGKANASM